jgi:hypothetical protein
VTVHEVSPSSLKLAKACWRSWAIRYVLGKRDDPPKASLVLGSLIHNCLEFWANGGSLYTAPITGKLLHEVGRLRTAEAERLGNTLDAQQKARELIDALAAEAPRRALKALEHLPDRESPNVKLRPEAPIKTDFSRYHPGARWKFSPKSSRDLVVVYSDTGAVDLKDYKSCSSWRYMPTPEELQKDVQFLFYALACLDERWRAVPDNAAQKGEWIYISTRNAPATRTVTVESTGEQLLADAQPWFSLADQCQVYIDNKPEVFSLEMYPQAEDPSTCEAYGGCPHHFIRGGPCRPNHEAKPFAHIKRETMNDILSQRIAATVNAGSMPFRPPEVAQHLSPPPAPTPAAPPAPNGTRTVNGVSYPVWGALGVQAVYANGAPVTDDAGNPVDSAGCLLATPTATPTATQVIESVSPPVPAVYTPPAQAPEPEVKSKRQRKTASAAVYTPPPPAPEPEPETPAPASAAPASAEPDVSCSLTLEAAMRELSESTAVQVLKSAGFTVKLERVL